MTSYMNGPKIYLFLFFLCLCSRSCGLLFSFESIFFFEFLLTFQLGFSFGGNTFSLQFGVKLGLAFGLKNILKKTLLFLYSS